MTSYYYLKNLPSCSKEELEQYLLMNNTQFTSIEMINTSKNVITAKIYFSTGEVSIPNLDFIETSKFKNTDIIISFTENEENQIGEDNIHLKLKLYDAIPVSREYERDCELVFTKSFGEEAFVFTDPETLDKQRAVLTHVIKSFGSNLLSGSGIMNVTLPINIFDTRSLLDLFAHQHRQLEYFMSKCLKEKHQAAKLKWISAFSVSRIHMTMTQLKPFNPILGETFQAYIGVNTKIYIEQTSHHPPIYNFLILNDNYKIYGFEEPRANTGANSVVANTYGKYSIELKDGTLYEITTPELYITGTTLGDRTYSVRGKIFITDKKNDYVSIVEFNPDERGFFGKLLKNKNTFPDYFKGFVTRISQCAYNKNDGYTPNSNHTKLIELTGCWQSNIDFEGETIWERNKEKYETLLRMEYTLPSDCTLRSDLIALLNKNEDLAQNEKIRLEEIQRKDRKLRATYGVNLKNQ